MPYAIYVLTAAPFLSALGTAVTMSLLMLVPLVVTDRLFYGRWTVSPLPNPTCFRYVSTPRLQMVYGL